MRNLKIFWALAVFAFVVLGAAAVWMGGINQDEGWYLYAANLVAEGQMPYRDFFYTQGPLLPIVYASFSGIWKAFGLLGARVFTLAIGFASIAFFCVTAWRLAPEGRKQESALVTFFMLGVNLYHLYYLAMPKTYALAACCVAVGCWLLTMRSAWFTALAALSFAFAEGARISLGVILAAVGLALVFRREWRRVLAVALGGFAALALVYGPFLLDHDALVGLVVAQQYHAARGGFDAVFTVGSVSRLVRWYLPVFIVLGLGVAGMFKSKAKCEGERGNGVNPLFALALDLRLLLFSFLAVFAVQMLAPFPYEDYQVPIMGLLSVYAAVSFVSYLDSKFQISNFGLLLVLGLCFASSFGSPLLEKWSTNGQDRFWSLKKEKYELAQLREVAKSVEALDPGGKTLFTQDLYLAIETNRKVPKGLEMGPFSMLDDAGWRRLISSADCPVAAISGYTFAVEPPKCNERPVSQQVEYFTLLKKNYSLADRVESFGQNSTTLMLLKRK